MTHPFILLCQSKLSLIMDIPTADDFLASKDVISDDDPVNNRSRTATVKRIGPYVMKYNGRTCLQEADNLAYIAAHTKIPVLKCYASGIVPNSELNGKYLIMDFIEGDTL
ncbi:unnamed protein product [Zymoseptoria tritici ST99CH_1E4]|uniref:Aminoglycoside phosphotransferase domain-containing protein n=1 Tax=Zymoseptoria tritici ST99CH_1E4 TaxID=1276532 RepID=A0A2H1GLU8_ZYMTR|nr:unnamed protein product [Zymoseptoria tritici ST99CH_1E4]